MKRAALILAALAAILTAAAAPVRTATENFVTNKIAEAVAAIPAPDYSTNNAALVETIQAKASAPDFTTGNETLVATIAATAPAPGDYATVSNRAMSALQSHQSLAHATNYTDAAIGAFAATGGVSRITDGTNTIDAAGNVWGGEYAPWVLYGLPFVWNGSVHAWTNENWYIEYNARYKYLTCSDSTYGLLAEAVAVEEDALSAELVYVEGAGEGVLGIATRESVYKFLGKLALANEIPQVVAPSMNAVRGTAADAKATGTALYTGFTEWVFSGSGYDTNKEYSVFEADYGSVYVYNLFVDGEWVSDESGLPQGALAVNFSSAQITATRRLITPTKTSQLTNDGSNGVPFVAETQLVAVSSTVDMWESYWDGTNVMFEVTNYYGNTSGEFPRLRIKENRNGVWTNVWDEATKFEVCERQILAHVSESNAAVLAEAREEFAPRAWGAYSDKGTTNVLPNTTFMANPETYFGGGTEYQRVAVGSGAVCVLVDRGALAKTAGEPGTFRFQDDGGTNYFGFSKSDSYTVGCNTDGITVEGNLVTLRYDVIMGGEEVPIVYWRLALDSGTWEQLNNSDGTAADGAPYTVTWYTSGGSYYAAINCGSNASGFFKAETSVMGDVVFETNMKARLWGGIVCTNTASGTLGVTRPTYNGSTVTWTWSAR